MALVEEWTLSDFAVIGGSICFEPYYYSKKGILHALRHHDARQQAGECVSRRRRDYDYFKMEWVQVGQREARQGIWSEPYYDDGGGDVMMISYVLPLFNKYGNMIGVMTADMSLEELVKDVAHLRPYHDSFSFVVSRRGTFIVHPRRSVILNQTIFSYADSSTASR